MVKWERGAKGYNIPKLSELGKDKLRRSDCLKVRW